MATSATASPLSNVFGLAQKKEEPYIGTMIFGQRTISFANTSILRDNITRIEKYNLAGSYRVSLPLLIFSIIAALIGIGLSPLGLLITMVFAIIIVIGIMERLKPKLTGLTIELNSGYTHTFLSSDKKGINRLFESIQNALENSSSLTAKWETNNIHIMNTNVTGSTGVVIGGINSNVNANINITAKNINSLNKTLKDHGIDQADIDELNMILKNETPDNANKKIGVYANNWITKIMNKAANGIGNISANLSIGLLIQFLSHYYGWS